MKKFAGFLGGLGIIMMVFGLIAVLFFAGALRAVGFSQLVAGAIGVSIYLVYFLTDTMHVIVKRRNDIFGVLGGLLIVALLIGVNVVAQSKFGERTWDTTVNRVHSLAPESQELAKNLTDTVHIYAFFDAGQRQADMLKNLVKKYSAFTNKLEMTFHDPNEEPKLIKQLEAGANEVILQRESTKRSIKLLTVSEEALTNALKKVFRSEEQKIYFLEGAGQASLERQEDAAGLFVGKFKLEAEGFKVQSLNLVQTKKIPADAKVVVSWGAKKTLSETETRLIEQYLSRGGQFVLAQDPTPSITKDRLIPTGLETALATYGLEIRPSIAINIVDLGQGARPLLNIFGLTYSQQPIVGKFTQENWTLFPMASPVTTKASYKGKATVTPLVSTSPEAWAEADIKSILSQGGRAAKDSTDLAGPFAIAQISEWSVEKPEAGDWGTTGKLIAIGNASFGSNQFIQNASNLDLFSNMFSYLIGDNVSPMSIKPRSFKASTLKLSDSEKRGIYYASVFIIPELLMILGLFIWLTRRART